MVCDSGVWATHSRNFDNLTGGRYVFVATEVVAVVSFDGRASSSDEVHVEPVFVSLWTDFDDLCASWPCMPLKVHGTVGVWTGYVSGVLDSTWVPGWACNYPGANCTV